MQTQLLNSISSLAGRAQFVALTYTNAQKEKARYTIILNGNYRGVLEKSLLELTIQLPDLKEIEKEACEALIASIHKSLAANAVGEVSEDYTKRGLYVPSGVPGVKVSTNDNTLELSGLLHSKVVLEPGEARKPVRSAPLTVAKNQLRRQTAQGKFRTFCLENIQSARINGNILELD